MGCASSKPEDSPAVKLCRERCTFLDDAIAHRFAFAEAHVAYTHTLKEIGASLDRFFHQDDDDALNLPPHKKGDPVQEIPLPPQPPQPPPPQQQQHLHPHPHSHSNSGSHLHFHTDDDDDDDDSDDDDDVDSGFLHHSTPLHHYQHQEYDETLNSNGGFMNFMQNRSTKSVVHQHRPMSPESVHMVGGSSYTNNNNYSPYYQNPNSNPNQNSYPYYDHPAPSYSNYAFYGSASPQNPPPYYASGYPPTAESTPKPPPPPPSPPRASAWDFLNPFETFDKYYNQDNTPSRDSRSVREEEGIPDLEEENFQDEVVKEVHRDHKFSDGGGNYSKGVAVEKEEEEEEKEGKKASGSGLSEKDGVGMQYEVHSVDKNVMGNEERSEEKNSVPTFNVKVGSRGVSLVIREIKSQFERASESGNEVSTMLEVGKVPFHRKNAVYQVSSKMLHSITPSLSVVSSQPSTSKSAETSTKAASVFLDIENVSIRSGNLSSTLQKLYIWEKKLFYEVKAEEKMRMLHERKVRRLKRLDEKGAEAQKIDVTRTLVRDLSTKIRIAIQVVDKISVKINKLRDEELWPQMNELIKGLIRMWSVMLECHQHQCQAIAEAKNLDAVTSNRKLNGEHVQATMQLEHELLNWISSFSSWISAQKGYVKALNGWLWKCLLIEHEETDDGIVPFSPGRAGAPPVFSICNQWAQAIDEISEKEVIDSMRVFISSVHQLSERHKLELRQRMLTDKDRERKVKELEREEQKMQKEWQTIDKKIALVSSQGIGHPIPGQVVHQSDTSNISSLHLGLKQIFEAMERFTASSMQAYEQLQSRCEEDMHTGENAKAT